MTYPVIIITDLKICMLDSFHSVFLRKQVSLIHFVNIPAKQTKKGIPLYINIRWLDFPRSPQTTIEPVERFVWGGGGCSSEILNLTPKGDHLGVAQAFCDP